MNKQIIFFSVLITTGTQSCFAGGVSQEIHRPTHVLPPMSPRTCQRYLQEIQENNNRNKQKSPTKAKKYYPLSLSSSNENIALDRSRSGSVSK